MGGKIDRNKYAGVAKLADAPDLGSGAARHVGSSPSTRTFLEVMDLGIRDTLLRACIPDLS
jgi:hypothetical protein